VQVCCTNNFKKSFFGISCDLGDNFGFSECSRFPKLVGDDFAFSEVELDFCFAEGELGSFSFSEVGLSFCFSEVDLALSLG
jgi:hypothetical protein